MKNIHIKKSLWIGCALYLLTGCAGDGKSGAHSLVNLLEEGSPPIANAGVDQSVLAGDTIVLDGSASTDADGEIVKYAWTIPNVGTREGMVVTETLATTIESGSYNVTLTVTDNDGNTDSDVMTYTISNNNENNNTRPEAKRISKTFNGCVLTPINITLEGSDADGDALVYEIIRQPGNGRVTLNGNIATYVNTSECGKAGTDLPLDQDNFSYRVNDGELDSDTADVRLEFEVIQK